METDEKILQAAETIFLRDGFVGARMQAIADEAGINKALLHYYFKSKRVLFERVVEGKINSFFPKAGNILFSSKSLIEKLEEFVERYIDFLFDNPLIPNFIVQTSYHDASFFDRLPSHMVEGVVQYIQMEVEAGTIRPVQPRQFIISVLGMCVFPFLARPIAKRMLTSGNDEQYDQLLRDRVEEVQQYVRRILEK